MKIYVLRHGRTNLNERNKYNCRIDEDLNKTGIEQAKRVAPKVKELSVDVVYCSPMRRTRQTLHYLDMGSIPAIFDDRLIERDCGAMTYQDVDPKFDEKVYHNFFAKDNANMESYSHMSARVFSLLDEIKQSKNERVLIITHGVVANIIRCYFYGVPEDGDLFKYNQKNCEIVEYDA